ncbi:aspartyl protease family protein 2-like [Canna indica]|uniref:Aspartyl protease family protein 2-like n=1 Tax=Canna indica TaxID=4628 RepID=A0AAQ3JKV1_9LILI|nr:aspartyl protease family protein 2-like [Canna indica]
MATSASRCPLLLLFLFSLVVLAAANDASKPLQRQTLVVTPLTSPAALLPDEDAAAAESLATAADSEVNLLSFSSVDIHLSHRDSLLAVTSSPEQIFHLRLERDAARVETLRHTLAAAVSAPPASVNVTGRRGFSSTVVSDRTSAGAPNRSSSVVFGDSAVPRASSRVAYTPMVRNPKVDTFYYIELTGVSVGGTRVSGVLASDLRLDPMTGRGGVIVDSGTSVTRLARPAYEALRDAFKAGTAGLKVAPGGFSLFDTCYDLSGRTEVKVPTVVLHLAGGAAVSLPAENYLIPVDTNGTFCFAFAGTDSGVSIIGNIQQQGYRVVFDGEKSRLGFVQRGC